MRSQRVSRAPCRKSTSHISRPRHIKQQQRVPVKSKHPIQHISSRFLSTKTPSLTVSTFSNNQQSHPHQSFPFSTSYRPISTSSSAFLPKSHQPHSTLRALYQPFRPFPSSGLIQKSSRLFSTNPTGGASDDSSSPSSPSRVEDIVAASIPQPRAIDEAQYKLASSGWTPPSEYNHLTADQREELRERFTIENSQRMHSALSRMRSTTGTIAYGAILPSDGVDGSMPQRNGSRSNSVMNAFERAEEYKKRNAKRQQDRNRTLEAKQALEREREQRRSEFHLDASKPTNEADFGEFSTKNDAAFKRQTSPEEQDKQRAEQLMGQNWLSRWF